MTNQELRNKIVDHLKTMDRVTLKMIHAMIIEFSRPIEEDDALIRELERISKNHRSGKSPCFTADEAIDYVRKNRQNTKGTVPLSKANEAELNKRIREMKLVRVNLTLLQRPRLNYGDESPKSDPQH